MDKGPVLGKVAGFVLVIDPENKRGKRERVEFSDLNLLTKRAHAACEEMFVSESPRVALFTVFQTTSGELEEQEGIDPIRPLGSPAVKVFCKDRDCENPVGWTTGYRDPRGSLCGSCRERQAEDADVDVDAVYERLARAEEF